MCVPSAPGHGQRAPTPPAPGDRLGLKPSRFGHSRVTLLLVRWGGGGRRVPGQPDAMLRGDAAGMGDGQGETAGTQPGYRPGVTVGSGAPTSSTATSAGPWLPKLLPVRFKRRWPLKANAPPTEATVWLPAWKIPVSWDARNKNRLFEPRLLGGSPFGDSPFTLTETQRKNLSVNRIVQRAPCAPGRVRPPPLGSRRPCTPGEAVA